MNSYFDFNLNKINPVHSSITDFPIDYNTFPLAKNCKMYTVELTKDQYIFIPSLWYHWIFTEPNTLSVHYEIPLIDFGDSNNVFLTSLENNMPFYKSVDNSNNITYDKFINNSLEYKYGAIFSENNDCIPVKKNNTFKFLYETSLKNIINISKNKNYYTYIGYNNIDDNNILSSYKNLDYILNPINYHRMLYKSSVWFTLDKKINSGLHHDSTINIINVIDGKKTIYLFNPDCKDNLYIKKFSLIPTLYNN